MAVTVVGEGPVAPSLLHAARAADTTANAKTLFMSTLLERESAAPEVGTAIHSIWEMQSGRRAVDTASREHLREV
jgi:hypothetical protein